MTNFKLFLNKRWFKNRYTWRSIYIFLTSSVLYDEGTNAIALLVLINFPVVGSLFFGSRVFWIVLTFIIYSLCILNILTAGFLFFGLAFYVFKYIHAIFYL